MGVDPLADQAPGWTPYLYGFNNPVRFIDPDGRFETDEIDPPSWEDIKGIGTSVRRDFNTIGNALVNNSFTRFLSKAFQSDGESSQNGGSVLTSKNGRNMGGLTSRTPPQETINIDEILDAAGVYKPTMAKQTILNQGSKELDTMLPTAMAKTLDAQAKATDHVSRINSTVDNIKQSLELDLSDVPGIDTVRVVYQGDTVNVQRSTHPEGVKGKSGEAGSMHPLK